MIPSVARQRGRKDSWAHHFVEEELERRYAECVGDLSQIPQRRIPLADVVHYGLDARTGFILGAIDGSTSFQDIIDLSPMSLRETLGILAQLIGMGIVRR